MRIYVRGDPRLAAVADIADTKQNINLAASTFTLEPCHGKGL